VDELCPHPAGSEMSTPQSHPRLLHRAGVQASNPEE
jgi:hypothetical protein